MLKLLIKTIKARKTIIYSFFESRKDFIFLVICLIIAAFFIFHHIGERNLWGDEAGVAIMTEKNFSELAGYAVNDAHPLFYAFLIKIWSLFFTNSEIGLRSLSAVFGLLTIVLIWKTAKDFFGSKTASIAVFLASTNYFLIFYSIQAKAYTLTSFMAVLLFYLFLKLLDNEFQPNKEKIGNKAKKPVFAYFLTATVSIYTHPWLIAVLLTQMLLLIIISKKKAFSGSFVVLWRLIFLVLLPEIAIACYQGKLGATNWIGSISFSDLISSFKYLAGYNSFWIYSFSFLIMFILWLEKIYREEKISIKRNEIIFFICLIACLVAPMISAFLFSMIKPVYVIGRYEMSVLPFFIIVISALWTMITNKRACLSFALLPLLLISVKNSVSNETALIKTYRTNDKIIIRNVIERVNQNDAVIVTGLSWASFYYYFPESRKKEKTALIPFPQETKDHPGWENMVEIKKQYSRYSEEAKLLAENLKDKNVRVFLVLSRNEIVNQLVLSAFTQRFKIEKTEKPEEPRGPSWIKEIIVLSR